MKRIVINKHYMPYVYGFIVSLAAILAAYIIVTQPGVSATATIIGVLVGLALIQLIAQVSYFLHLGDGPRPRWHLLSFLTMVMVVGFIVVGSLWIMANLDYNMMGDQMDEGIIKDEGINL